MTTRSIACILAAAMATVFMLSGLPEAASADEERGAGLPVREASKQDLERVHRNTPAYSPYVQRQFPTRPLFGDTHMHTSFSMDAGAFGARLDPRDAYRFARGEQVISNTGQPARLSRPLDFLVVADHSDGFGFFPQLMSGDPQLLATEKGRRWYDLINSGNGAEAAVDIIRSFGLNQMPEGYPVPGTRAYRSAWKVTIEAAEEFNEPGRFTAFIGYEWTSNTRGNNLHRNIIFRDGADKALMVEPYTTLPPLGSDNPEDLWKWMSATEQTIRGDVLAIAHNGNLSNGTMFPTVEAFGQKLDRDYAEQRNKWERLYEVTQTKGTSEAHPFLSPNDEFAGFEIWDKGNLDLSAVKENEMLEFEYARSALKNGLLLEQEYGTNPYKFGLIGSSDAHTGLAAMAEENFFGKTAPQEPNPERLTKMFVPPNEPGGPSIMDWEVAASGYAAVWATENTREAIFDAMERRETYATTGSRMLVRFFGGWEFESLDAQTRMPAEIGYTRGVPMGGTLTSAPEGRSPTFLVAALKDPIGANLDRIQIVKGWLDRRGRVHEKVYDVVWGDAESRRPDSDGRIPPVGDTVDVANATWTNSIGDPELIAVWTDPDFDARQAAFYYARVLEIPTPRWTAYDARFFGTEPVPGTRMKLQERAYTSPIWFTP